jgi:hypothetical protein
MLFSYAMCIYFLYDAYQSHSSISGIVQDENCQKNILFSMGLLAGFTLFYEFGRECVVSFLSILGLLIGIFGVIFIKETQEIHYIFAFLVFISIFGFMFWNTWKNEGSSSSILLFSFFAIFYISFISMIYCLVLDIKTGFFYSEITCCLIFAIFYLFLHFLSNLCPNPYLTKEINLPPSIYSSLLSNPISNINNNYESNVDIFSGIESLSEEELVLLEQSLQKGFKELFSKILTGEGMGETWVEFTGEMNGDVPSIEQIIFDRYSRCM